jgi:hypothetical protein
MLPLCDSSVEVCTRLDCLVVKPFVIFIQMGIYMVIQKSLRNFELDSATTNTDTAERSISVGRESLASLFV